MQTRFLSLVLAVLLSGASGNLLAEEARSKQGASTEREFQEIQEEFREAGGGQKNMFNRRSKAFREVLEKLEKENPEEFKRLMELKKTNQDEYIREVHKKLPDQIRIPQRVAELDRKSYMLATQYKIARTDAEKEAIKKELEPVVAESTEAMIENLKLRLKNMQQHLDEMEKNRDTLNKKRMEMLLSPKARPMQPKGDKGPRPNGDKGPRPNGDMMPPPPDGNGELPPPPPPFRADGE